MTLVKALFTAHVYMKKPEGFTFENKHFGKEEVHVNK